MEKEINMLIKGSYCFLPNSPQQLPVHERLYVDSSYRRMLHQMTQSTPQFHNLKQAYPNKIQNKLLQKGNLSIQRKEKLKQYYSQLLQQTIQTKPLINPNSKKIIQRKRKQIQQVDSQTIKSQDQNKFLKLQKQVRFEDQQQKTHQQEKRKISKKKKMNIVYKKAEEDFCFHSQFHPRLPKKQRPFVKVSNPTISRSQSYKYLQMIKNRVRCDLHN